MNDLTCMDCYGNTLYYFTQWDINQKMYIEDSGLTVAPEFHFQNKNTTEALVVRSKIQNGVIIVDVPNQLLMEGFPISIYVYLTQNKTSSKAIYSLQFPVRKRQKPSNYIYSDNVNNIDYSTIKELQEKIDDLNDLIDELKDKLEEMEDDYVFVDNDDTGNTGDDSGGNDNTDDDNTGDDTTNDIPEGRVYLYNRGVMSDILGGFTNNNSTFEYSEESDHLAIVIPAGTSIVSGYQDVSNALVSNTPFDTKDFLYSQFEAIGNMNSTFGIEYEYVYKDTGEVCTELNNEFGWRFTDPDSPSSGSGYYSLEATKKCHVSTSNYISDNLLLLFVKGIVHETEDITLKIYSIYFDRSICYEKYVEADKIAREVIDNYIVTNDTTITDVNSAIQEEINKLDEEIYVTESIWYTPTKATATTEGLFKATIMLRYDAYPDNPYNSVDDILINMEKVIPKLTE